MAGREMLGGEDKDKYGSASTLAPAAEAQSFFGSQHAPMYFSVMPPALVVSGGSTTPHRRLPRRLAPSSVKG